MALVRILVDGYSLLHSWPELAPSKARHSSAAREELIHLLTRYRDAIQTPITVVFDGSMPRGVSMETRSTPEVEILYSQAGQTADQMIERAAHRLRSYGEVLVVTNDHAERDTVLSFGGMASSCENFIRSIELAFAEMDSSIKHFNRREKNRYKNPLPNK